MAAEGLHGVGAAHAHAVVYDLHERRSGPFEEDVDAFGPGVEAVLHELLQGGGGALHDLARRDLVGERVGHHADQAVAVEEGHRERRRFVR